VPCRPVRVVYDNVLYHTLPRPRFPGAEICDSVPRENCYLRTTSSSMNPAPRACTVTDCDRPARRRGTHCERCHKRAWRDANRKRAKASEKARSFSTEALTLRKARAIIAMALQRGHLRRQPCAVCAKPGLPHHPDPTKAREIVWLCRTCRRIERERAVQAAAAEATAARKAEWEALRQEFTDAWPQLAPAEREAIWAIARREPLIASLPLEAPLAQQALIRAYETRHGGR
jgi:hypothetical protein